MFWLRKYSRAGERQAARSAHTQRQDQEGLSAGASRKDKQRRATIGANLRPRLDVLDKLFWVAIRRFWSGWQQSLIAVTPETVVRWHKAGFRLYWKLISKVRRPVGRRQTSKEIRELIFRMVVENPTWGAPRIHGELLMLGFDVSERTISRWMKRAPRDPEPAALAYLSP